MTLKNAAMLALVSAGLSLLWFNPATHAVQLLMRAPAGTAGVIADVPYGHGS